MSCNISDSKLPRGIRNNNPGNIRKGQKWRGLAKEQNDPAFDTFTTAEYGIRALAKVLLTYERKYGLNTVRGIIGRWAPPNENNTTAYVNHVAALLSVDPDQVVSVREKLPLLIPAIIQHENGIQPYSEKTIADGIGLI